MATRSLLQPSSRLQTSHVEGIIPYVLMASVHDAVYSQSTETSCLRFSTTAAVVFLVIPGAGTAGIFCFYYSICWWYNCCCCNQGTDEESLHWDDKNMGDTTESGVHRAYLQKGECHGFEAKNSKVAPNFTFLILLSLGSATFYTASFQWVGWKESYPNSWFRLIVYLERCFCFLPVIGFLPIHLRTTSNPGSTTHGNSV